MIILKLFNIVYICISAYKLFCKKKKLFSNV